MANSNKILADFERAKRNAGKVRNAHLKISLKPGERSTLGKVVNTKEKAEAFMKLLKKSAH